MYKIKFIYYYLFYKFYKHFEKGPSIWFSEWKASLAMDLMVFLILFILILYYNIFIDKSFNFDVVNLRLISGVLYTLVIVIPNYFIFNHNNKWKSIVVEFDKLPKRKNVVGGWLVIIFIMLLILSLVYGYYLMSKIDWSKYYFNN